MLAGALLGSLIWARAGELLRVHQLGKISLKEAF